ncbi:putative ribonuclease H-like domain-containing protein [Tanacetum coccineum]
MQIWLLFSQETAEILSQAEAEIRNQGVSADRDPAGIDSAGGVSAGSTFAGSDPAGSFQPAGSYEPAGKGNPAVSTSVSAAFILVHADESTLPPGQSLGSSENITISKSPSDVCKEQLSSGIFTSYSYDDDFSATFSNLAPAVGKWNPSSYNKLEPTSIAKALEDPDWVDAMQEEMQQFINQQVWKLVPLPVGKHAIGTKWILKNKRDARGIVVRNKARLVAQGHRQEEGIDYDEVFAPVARIEAIRLFLAFASYMGFLVYQLDVKSAFLYGEIEEEVYVTQPKGFEDPYFPKHVYRVVKALYGLHQAPRAWYARLSTFLLQHNYRRGTIDKTLFIKKDSRDIILVQVYVDDIIFGSTNKAWCDEFEVLMKGEFEMSAMGEMTFFLGLQVKQLPDGLFISQDKYVKDMLTKFDMESVRTATTPYEAAKTKLKDETDPPVNVHLYRSMIGSLMYLTASRPDIMFAVSACSRHQVTPLTSHLNAVKKIFKYLKGQPKLGLWYPKDSPFQLEAYSDSDYAGSHGDRKSTTGGCQFLGRRLISWQCKKQTIVATSSTEAEYVAAASCCAQVLWIQNQLLDYGFNFMNTKIFIDNQSTICIVKNPVFHQRTKHIEIRHHFIRDANEKNLIQVLKIHTDDNVADLLTKAFDGPRFAYLVVHIGMVDMVLVSAGCTMVLLVVILPAGRMVSAGWSMVLLVVIFPAARLVSAGCSMVLLLLYLLDSLFLLVAMGYAASSFHPAGSTPMSGSAVPDTAGGPLDTTGTASNIPTSAAMDSAASHHELGISPFADSDDSSSPSPVSTDHVPIDVLVEPTQGGIHAFFLDSDEDEQIGLSRVAAEPDSDDEVLAEILFRGQYVSAAGVVVVDKLPDDEIVDPRVKVEPISESPSSPPRSRSKHRGSTPVTKMITNRMLLGREKRFEDFTDFLKLLWTTSPLSRPKMLAGYLGLVTIKLLSSEDIVGRARKEVPLRRKRSVHRRARTEFYTQAFAQFHAPRSTDVLPHADISESAGPSVGTDKGKAPMPDLEIPAEFLAEDAQARQRLEKNRQMCAVGPAVGLSCYFVDAMSVNILLSGTGVRLLISSITMKAVTAYVEATLMKKYEIIWQTVWPSVVPAGLPHYLLKIPDSAGGSSFHPAEFYYYVGSDVPD